MSRPAAEECLLCRAERLTTWYFESAECWVADCMVCATPMVVWRAHGLPSEERERELLDLLSKTAAERFGPEGFWIDPDRRRIPDHWHAHARPQGGFFGPDSPLYGKDWSG
ncbi:MAG TPA: hypothetical protein VKK30_04570 [Actinomycetota bacterium]|nr:hypothetical protein [Actinomycetota bacterium]